ncbi:TPA: hypothetical protein EYP37_06855 [Candidatus Poribacteria bacterium]|nr:hypothetical protein [Candidatus Poribacteria bacterium]
MPGPEIEGQQGVRRLRRKGIIPYVRWRWDSGYTQLIFRYHLTFEVSVDRDPLPFGEVQSAQIYIE